MPPRGILKKCTIAIAGDHGPQRQDREIRRWIEQNGGQFAAKLTKHVTHLICSRVHFNSHKISITKQLSRNKSLKIVTFDWLEDSLLKKSKKRETKYLLESRATTAEAEAEARRTQFLLSLQKFEKSRRKLTNVKSDDGYHIYRDATGFAYDILLARKDLVERHGSGITGTLKVGYPHRSIFYIYNTPCPPLVNPRTQCLQLYESDSELKTYACYLISSAPQGSHTIVLASKPSSFLGAMGQFELYFKSKTGVEWASGDLQGEELKASRSGMWNYLRMAQSSDEITKDQLSESKPRAECDHEGKW